MKISKISPLILLSICTILVSFNCSDKQPQITPGATPPEDIKPSNEDDFPIAIADQGSGKIKVFDTQKSDWNKASSLLWSWFPNESNGFAKSTSGWGAPSDVKLRNSSFYGSQVMAVADSRGFCALIPYPAGNTKYWSTNVGGPGSGLNNLHAIELLPNGNTAIAASNGSYVRVYTSSQGPESTTFVSFTLDDAHGLLWDPNKNVLWALGRSILTALEIGGTPDSPIINEIVSYRVSLPTAGGHDLYAYYGDTNTLWVTTHYGVYTFNKTTKTFTKITGPAFGIAAKSVGNQPSGQIVQARPSTCSDGWNTNTVRFYEPLVSRTITGACLYKARIWWNEYQ